MFENFPAIKRDHPLAPYSSFRIGGPADFFYNLQTLNELDPLLTEAKRNNIAARVIGGGSNILFRDQGFRGLIIRMAAQKITIENDQLIAEAGARVSLLILAARRAGFIALDPLQGLPGTVGGAVYGNAGACGLEMKDLVLWAELFHPDRGFFILTNQMLKFLYRKSLIKTENKDDIICRVALSLKSSALSPISTAKKLVSVREKQPKGLSCGCWFVNPANDSAGRLIDQAGLKGFAIGDAQVSTTHANFIINRGQATAKEVLALADYVRLTVKKTAGVDLEDEVRVI